MEIWLQAARIAAAVNLVILGGLGAVWFAQYRQHGARHTLGLLIFASLLLVQNLLWLYFYVLHPDFIGWFVNSGLDVQIGVTMLCGFELVALLFLARITWV